MARKANATQKDTVPAELRKLAVQAVKHKATIDDANFKKRELRETLVRLQEALEERRAEERRIAEEARRREEAEARLAAEEEARRRAEEDGIRQLHTLDNSSWTLEPAARMVSAAGGPDPFDLVILTVRGSGDGDLAAALAI